MEKADRCSVTASQSGSHCMVAMLKEGNNGNAIQVEV